jgi:hypothetical protein
MASPVWLVEITAGQTWRFATREVVYDGHAYLDGLEDPGNFPAGFGLDEPQELSVPLTIWTQGSGIDLVDVALGASGVLYYWDDPDGAAAPVVLLSGVLDDPEYGGPDEPMTTSISEEPWKDRGAVLPATAVVESQTWPDVGTGSDAWPSRGEMYPMVIGSPGDSAGFRMGSPALEVERYGAINAAGNLILIAGHHVSAATVTLVVPQSPPTVTAAVVNGVDSKGQPVAWIDTDFGTTGWTSPPWDRGKPVFVRWEGLPAIADNGAGDIIERLLRSSTLRVDWGRMRAALNKLNVFRLDTYIQAEKGKVVRPWDWISDELLPILPVGVRRSPRGIYLAVFDVAAAPGDTLAHLSAGRNCERISPVSSIADGVANDFLVRYSYDAQTGDPTNTARVTGDAAVLDAYSGAIRAPGCEESIRRFGVIRATLNASAVWDSPTAVAIATHHALRRALPVLEIAYTLDDTAHLRALEPGDAVRLSDSEIGIAGRVAHVWSVRVAPVREVVLRLWSVPGRDF